MVFKYLLSPKLFKEYGEADYEPLYLEKIGDSIFSFLNLLWNLGYYTSPLIITYLYRKGYFVAESIHSLLRVGGGLGVLIAVTLCLRSVGRAKNPTYQRFVKCLEDTTLNPKSEEFRRKIRKFDFDFDAWPIDWDINNDGAPSKPVSVKFTGRNSSNSFWLSPCQIAAYLAVHTFGIKMIYPGSVKLIQKYLQPILLQGRTKLVFETNATRYKIKTNDNNSVDMVFIDNRNVKTPNDNGKTLVICSEGNAGFYEIGIVSTPLELKYSVIGWNHPGFGGSTGCPYPEQDQKAIDAVVQFAIHKLNFSPENILMYGWSIGGYNSLYIASKYVDIKGVVLDATFDDLLYLALPRMPESLSNIVKIAIRDYVNLNNNELVSDYNGPVLMIRRTDDEVISEEMDISSNRGNYLLINMLKQRFPKIFENKEQVEFANEILSKSLDHNAKINDNSYDQLCLSLLMTYVSENSASYPLLIGEEYDRSQKNQMILYLIKKHLLDYKSTHCTPLPTDFFKNPWTLPSETDFVFT